MLFHSFTPPICCQTADQSEPPWWQCEWESTWEAPGWVTAGITATTSKLSGSILASSWWLIHGTNLIPGLSKLSLLYISPNLIDRKLKSTHCNAFSLDDISRNYQLASMKSNWIHCTNTIFSRKSIFHVSCVCRILFYSQFDSFTISFKLTRYVHTLSFGYSKPSNKWHQNTFMVKKFITGTLYTCTKSANLSNFKVSHRQSWIQPKPNQCPPSPVFCHLYLGSDFFSVSHIPVRNISHNIQNNNWTETLPCFLITSPVPGSPKQSAPVSGCFSWELTVAAATSSLPTCLQTK